LPTKSTRMHAEIITIGDEILIGQTVDTNSAWMAKQLNAIGISIQQITSIADTREAILNALAEVNERADLVLMTGGLGPTRDDITKFALCEYFETHLVMNDNVREGIETWFEARGIPVLEVNRRQAELPAACEVLRNRRGTAQGMWFEKEGTVFVSMPGVPYEMKGIVEEQLLTKLMNHFERPHIEHYTLMTSGIGESLLAHKVKDWEDSLDAEDIHIAYLPSPGIVKVRLSAFGDDKQAIQEKIQRKAKEFEEQVGEYVFGYNDMPLHEAVGNLLKEHRRTVSTAESCTGGRIAAALAEFPGSSAFFIGGVVAYANEAKMNLLGVDADTLAISGAVSQAVIEAMALGAQQRFATDFAVATSGVAGPDGGTETKPVGTVWIAVATPNGVKSMHHNFGGDRERNIVRAVQATLTLLRNEILASGVAKS